MGGGGGGGGRKKQLEGEEAEIKMLSERMEMEVKLEVVEMGSITWRWRRSSWTCRWM